MEEYIKDITEKLEEIYVLYERYVWKHKESKIYILIQDNTILYYLKGPNGLEEEFELSFNENEEILYHYLSLQVLAIVLGNVYVHQDKNILFNNVHRPYVKMFVNDENVLAIMIPILSNQNKHFIRTDMIYMKNAFKLLQEYFYTSYNESFIQELGNRINLTKRLLRGDI